MSLSCRSVAQMQVPKVTSGHVPLLASLQVLKVTFRACLSGGSIVRMQILKATSGHVFLSSLAATQMQVPKVTSGHVSLVPPGWSSLSLLLRRCKLRRLFVCVFFCRSVVWLFRKPLGPAEVQEFRSLGVGSNSRHRRSIVRSMVVGKTKPQSTQRPNTTSL